MTKSTLRRRLAPLSAALAVTAVLAGCGSGGGSDDDGSGKDVASVATSRPTEQTGGKAAKEASDSGRPQWRLDSTSEEIDALWSRYYGCLKEHGVRFVPANEAQHAGPAGEGEVIADPDSREPKAAYDTCESKMPQMPDALDPDKNPQYKKQLADEVTCMNDKGVPTEIAANGVDWTYSGDAGSALSEEQQRKIENDCQLEAFGGGK
ncbi:hypothetical protein [Streptomyces sp. NPDC088794]|uniref:hypothetical protein n=1 Tax=Streptomyces sp. NPDC088794 TaxID=3365902 RepID=UPI0037FC7694